MAVQSNSVRVEPVLYGAKIYGTDDCHPDAVVHFDERGPSVTQYGDRLTWEVWGAISSVVADYRAKMGG